MSSRCSGGRQVVALQDILVFRLALVEVVVLSSDAGQLEHIAQLLSSCTKTEQKTRGELVKHLIQLQLRHLLDNCGKYLVPKLKPETFTLTFLPLSSVPIAMGRSVIHDDLQ